MLKTFGRTSWRASGTGGWGSAGEAEVDSGGLIPKISSGVGSLRPACPHSSRSLSSKSLTHSTNSCSFEGRSEVLWTNSAASMLAARPAARATLFESRPIRVFGIELELPRRDAGAARPSVAHPMVPAPARAPSDAKEGSNPLMSASSLLGSLHDLRFLLSRAPRPSIFGLPSFSRHFRDERSS